MAFNEKRYTIGQCKELFMLDLEGRCSAATIENYENHLKYFSDFIKSEFQYDDNTIIDNIKLQDLQKYQKYLRTRKKNQDHLYKPVEDKCISMTTIRDYVMDIKTFFSFCYRLDYMDYEITKNLKLAKRDQVEKLPLYQSEVEQIENMFKGRTEGNARNLAIIHCGLDAGLRSGEVINLRLKDIDTKRNFLFVNLGKGNKSRYVPLSNRLKNYLVTYKTLHRFNDNNDDSYFFFNIASNEPITKDTLKQMYSRVKKNTSIFRLNHHLLRHTFATAFMSENGNIELLRNYMGHSSFNITQNYLHIVQKYKAISDDIYKLDPKFIRNSI